MRSAWPLYLLLFVLKIFFAYRLPLITDEAYYIQWGSHPSWFYYDHPPLVGWIAYLIDHIAGEDGNATLRLLAFRSVSIVGMFAVAWLISLFATEDKQKRHLIALLYLLLPESFASVVFSTDFIALFFSTCGGILWWKSLASRNLPLAFVAGLTLSLGFLGKETQCFALVGIGFWWLSHLRSAFVWKNFFAVQLGFWPLILYWLWEVAHACGGAFLLHFGRVDWQAEINWIAPFLFFLQDLLQETILIGPWTIWKLAESWRLQKGTGQSAGAVGTPLIRRMNALVWLIAGNWICFAVLALKRPISLHWGVLFHPFVFILAGAWLSNLQLQRLLRFQKIFAAALCAFLVIVLCAPLSYFHALGDGYKFAVFMKEQSSICRTLDDYKKKNPMLRFASPNYGFGASLQFTCNQLFSVINSQMQYGRSDDLWTDWRDLEGADVLVFSVEELREQEFATYFSEVTLRRLPTSDPSVFYYLIYGKIFHWEDYKRAELVPLRDRFYSHPLLHTGDYCPFIRKYFPDGR